MKFLPFLFAVFLVGCGSSNHPTEITSEIVKNNYASLEEYPETKGSPEIIFNEIEHQFPDMEQGDVLTHSFFFVNSGDKPLIFTNVKGSCGCTGVEYPEAPIMPGQKGAITAEINTASKPVGKLFKVAVLVESNALSKRKRLWLKGKPKE